MVSIGANSVGNRWVLNDDRNGSAGIGVDDYASGNTFTLPSSGFPSGDDIILENGATGNLAMAVNSVSYTDRNPTAQNNVITGWPRDTPGGRPDVPAAGH